VRFFRRVRFFVDVEPGFVQAGFPLSGGWFGARVWRRLGINIIAGELQRRSEMPKCVYGWRMVRGVGCLLLRFAVRQNPPGLCLACRGLQFHRCAWGVWRKGGDGGVS